MPRVRSLSSRCTLKISDWRARSTGFDTRRAPSSARASRRERAAEGERTHLERQRHAQHGPPDVTEPEDTDGATLEADRARVLVFFPEPRTQRVHRVRHAPVEAADEGEGELGDGLRVPARSLRDVDPALAREGDVDVARAGTGTNHEIQRFSGGERVCRHLGSADDEDVDPLEAGGQLDPGDARLVLDLHAEATHLVEGILAQSIGDQYAHGARLLSQDGTRRHGRFRAHPRATAEAEHVPRLAALLEQRRGVALAGKAGVGLQHRMNERTAQHERARLGVVRTKVQEDVSDVSSRGTAIGIRHLPAPAVARSHAQKSDATAVGGARHEIRLLSVRRRSDEALLRQPIEDVIRRRRMPIHEPSRGC